MSDKPRVLVLTTMSSYTTPISKWDRRFLSLAEHISTWSKDPSTKVGCVITRLDKTIAGVGYNGYPRGVPDDDIEEHSRELKYRMMVHAEENALLHCPPPAAYGGTVYTWPFQPCSRCTTKIIQAGIQRVVSVEPSEGELERWGEDFEVSKKLLEASGTVLDVYPILYIRTGRTRDVSASNHHRTHP